MTIVPLRDPGMFRAHRRAHPTDPDVFIVPDFGIQKLGDPAGYWSLTCSILERRRNGRMVYVGGGAAHDQILAAFPEFAFVERLHLSRADTGVPMHATANGFYFASGGARRFEEQARSQGLSYYPLDREPYSLSDYARAAQMLRVSVDLVSEIMQAEVGWVEGAIGLPVLVSRVRSKEHFQMALHKRGVYDQWQRETNHAKLEMVKLTGCSPALLNAASLPGAYQPPLVIR